MSVNKPIGAKDLPEDWKWLYLEDLCSRVSVGHVGETNSHFCGEEGVPFLRSQNIRPGNVVLADVKYVTKEFHQKSKKSQLIYGDIAIVRVGQNRGDCAVIPPNLPEVNCANIVFARLSDIRYSEFIGAFFNTSFGRESLLAVSTGSAQGVLNTKSIAKVVVPVPPVEKAYEIGKVYKSFLNKLELNLQTNQTLEQMAQSIFKSWFVDFDPVEAKMNGEQPEGMAAATASLFPEKLVESELGLIPDGWDIASIKDFGSVICGKTPSKKNVEFYGGDVPFIKIPDTHGKVFITETTDTLTNAGDESQPKKRIPKNSICVSCIATVGQVFITTKPSHTNQQINSVVPHDTNSLYYLLFKFKGLNNHFHDLASGGSATLNMNTRTFSNVELVRPTADVIEAFHNSISGLMQKMLTNQLENATLAELRDTLLPKLLSGEIELKVR